VYQVRIHGRGGQGVVTGGELLAVAAFLEGRRALSFPSFGAERMGAPVTAHCRIDDREIRLREPVTEPDALIVLDAALVREPGLFRGLRRVGLILIDSARSLAELGLSHLASEAHHYRLCRVPATELALAAIGRPVPNAALLGAFAAVSGEIRFESVVAAIRTRFPGSVAAGNVAAAAEAHALALKSREAIHA
jgi:pyruvate ferredoxin oxidoreductase gamma subunit